MIPRNLIVRLANVGSLRNKRVSLAKKVAVIQIVFDKKKQEDTANGKLHRKNEISLWN